jgi:hypothetical protein
MRDLLPDDVNKLQQDYLENNIKKSTTLLAHSMETDSTFKSLDFEKQCVYIQIMAEWSFHKEIDLFRSGIPAKYWKVVMQKIWYTMWEVMYACIQNEAPEGVVLSVIERYVNRTYQDAVEELKNINVIDDITEEKAKEQSNIEIMAYEYINSKKHRKVKRILYHAALLVIISCVVTFLVMFFKVYGVIAVLSLMFLYNIIAHEKEE